MEREILFRGKRVDNGEWVEGFFVKYQPCASDDKWIVGIVPEYASALYLVEVVLETISRYTGLTDKNGRRIFEGDILEYHGKRYVIKYLEKYMRFSPSNAHAIFAVFDYTQSEIISNIHDNPELLGGGEDNE